jgi:hypothetical protein
MGQEKVADSVRRKWRCSRRITQFSVIPFSGDLAAIQVNGAGLTTPYSTREHLHPKIQDFEKLWCGIRFPRILPVKAISTCLKIILEPLPL